MPEKYVDLQKFAEEIGNETYELWLKITKVLESYEDGVVKNIDLLTLKQVERLLAVIQHLCYLIHGE